MMLKLFSFSEGFRLRFNLNFLIFIVFLISSCAWSDEGAVDYRRAEYVDVKDLRSMDGLNLLWKNIPPADEDAVISEKDSVSFYLRSAFIEQYGEPIPNPLRGFKYNGEIAIVANVFELGNGKDYAYDDPFMKDGRLVFYCEDVEQEQFFNFNHMPIYGPIEYGGAPVALQLAIFELDGSTAEAKALLGSLAEAGSIAYAPANPLLELLNTLGKSFLDGQQDDIEFKYACTFMPRQGYQGLRDPALVVGNYIFIREHDRQNTTPWDRLEFNENEARLYWKAAEGKSPQPYTDNTYLVVEVNKNQSSKSIDLSGNTFGAFLKNLEQADLQKAENLASFTNSLMNLAIQRRQISEFDEAKNLLSKLRRAQSEVQRKRATFDLFEIIQGAYDDASPYKLKGVDAEQPANASSLSEGQLEYVLRNLRKEIKDVSRDDLFDDLTSRGISKQATAKNSLSDGVKDIRDRFLKALPSVVKPVEPTEDPSEEESD